jgi:ribosomal-protein-alanine N-acetyltransferase
MQFLPIAEHLSENKEFVENPTCDSRSLQMSVDFYKKVGFLPPWICYFVKRDNELVGGVAFKGKPIDNRVEIAYGIFPPYMHQGIGTEVCSMLVELALATDPNITITARTLPEENYSTKILRKNGFKLLGNIYDEEDGNVWEWEYVRSLKVKINEIRKFS